MKKSILSHLATLILGGILFSSVSFATVYPLYTKTINVDFHPLKFIIDGFVMASNGGERGFIYNGTTYVPLRFISSALGKPVNWDGKTYSVIIGQARNGNISSSSVPFQSANNVSLPIVPFQSANNASLPMQDFWIKYKINGNTNQLPTINYGNSASYYETLAKECEDKARQAESDIQYAQVQLQDAIDGTGSTPNLYKPSGSITASQGMVNSAIQLKQTYLEQAAKYRMMAQQAGR